MLVNPEVTKVLGGLTTLFMIQLNEVYPLLISWKAIWTFEPAIPQKIWFP